LQTIMCRLGLFAILCLGVATVGRQASADDNAWDWGANSHRQLGDGTTYNRHAPVRITGMSSIIGAAGGQYHSVVLKSDGTAWAWGENTWGTVGDGTTTTRSTPVQVSGISGAAAIAAGALHNLALLADGTVRAWGANGNGSVGDGTTTDRWTSVPVSSLTNVIAVSGGGYHSLALRSDGTVWAWGANWSGQLGDGTTTVRSVPVQVPGLAGITAISGGGVHSLALKSDGTVWAWGENGSGQLGDSTTTTSLSPVQVYGLTGVTGIAGGGAHSLARVSDGTVWAWGANYGGQLGDGTTTDSLTPVQVSNLTGCTALAAGAYSLALKSDGTAWAWGLNEQGELGDNTGANSSIPVQVFGLTGVVAIGAGSNHGIALLPPRIDTSIYAPDRSGIITTTATLKGYLKRLSDNAWLAGRSLDFLIDGVPVGSTTTDANGQAVQDWIISPGSAARTISVQFAGDAGYTASSTTATLTAQTVATKVYVVDRTAQIKGYTVLKAYLFLTNNTLAPAGKLMAIKLDGTVLGSGNTNATGCFPIGYTVSEGVGAGVRVIRGEWVGDGGFLASANTGKLTVTKGDLYVWPYVRSGKRGTSHPLQAYVRSLPDYLIQPGKSITFSVNGTPIGTAATAATGWATAAWAIPAGEPTGAHTATAEFAGDAWYLPVTVNTAFNVVP
jgi:alpha-tubulin suppressor-like RCC1 family protein